MGNDSKSVLKISQVIATLMAFIIVATSTQFLVSNKNIKETEIAKEEEQQQNVITNEIRVATSRSSAPREEIVEEKQEYISISEIEISKDMDLTVRCGISKQDFKELISNVDKDTTKFFYDNSDLIYDLCQKYELNEIFFCGLIAGESGWNIAKGHREKCNYISAMNSKGKLIKYSTVDEGLESAAKLLHEKYLTPGGSCYKGKTLQDVKKRFCPNSTTWVNLIYKCMNQIV